MGYKARPSDGVPIPVVVFPDTIYAYGGADRIHAWDGDDTLRLGGGSDQGRGGRGKDYISAVDGSKDDICEANTIRIDSLILFSESPAILHLFGARRLSQQYYPSFPEP